MNNTVSLRLSGAMNNLELAWAALVEPKRAFGALRDQPRFWFPLLTAALAYTAFFAWYFNVVDMAWLGDRMINADPRMKELAEADREAAAGSTTRSVLLWGTLLTLVLGTVLMRVLEAGYFLLAGKAAALRLSFRHWMALACWSAWPHVLLVPVMAFAVLSQGNGQIALEQLSLLSLNELFFHTPMGHPWNSLLATLTLLHPWVWWLTVLGMREWSGRSWAFSAAFALAPVAALYGIWALIALLS